MSLVFGKDDVFRNILKIGRTRNASGIDGPFTYFLIFPSRHHLAGQGSHTVPFPAWAVCHSA
ncbi:hypothetical protein AA11826_0162 [Komagataeibacter oboediens DSM 11826]|nr:hypothetical protein AA11826_0162 [Komagataeibacter oboediens DSM 11826]